MAGVSHSTIYRILDEQATWTPQADTLGKLESFVTQWDAADSQSVSRETGIPRVTEPKAEPFTPDPALARHFSPRVYEIAKDYLRRLDRVGVAHSEIEDYERVLLDPRVGKIYREATGQPMPDDQQIVHIERIFEAISISLSRRGLKP